MKHFQDEDAEDDYGSLVFKHWQEDKDDYESGQIKHFQE